MGQKNLMVLRMLFRVSLVIALWLAWKRTASLPLCLAFWIIVLIWCVRPIASRRPSAVWALVLIGVLSNAVVTLASFGVMPANYDVATFIPASPIWQPAVDRHLLLLSDQRALSYFSIGDLCLLTGSVLAFILRRRRRQAMLVHLLPRRDTANHRVTQPRVPGSCSSCGRPSPTNRSPGFFCSITIPSTAPRSSPPFGR
jgi:hypothetical protein